jgi:hypothetical protein
MILILNKGSTGVLLVILRIICNKLKYKECPEISGQLLLVKAVKLAAISCIGAGTIAAGKLH